MSIDTSINNVGEYYSSHYLSSTFLKDIKSLVADWRKQGSAAVPRRIQQLSRRYFRAKAQALEADLPQGRYLDELRRVKHYIATRNIYGVDLNPTALTQGDVDPRRLHFDTTSISVFGDYDLENSPFQITYGHSKDKRAGL